MNKIIAFFKTKLGAVVLGILALLATLTPTLLDDKGLSMFDDFIKSQPAVEQPSLRVLGE